MTVLFASERIEEGTDGVDVGAVRFLDGEDSEKGLTGCEDELSVSDAAELPGSVSMEDEDDERMAHDKQVVVGICAMQKKSTAKPMIEILSRLEEFEYIRTCVFPEETILKDPVEKWPICDCFISFHSKGYPLEKAQAYAALRKPYIVNDLEMQYDLQDRRAVYRILEKEGIEIPRYAILDRDSPDPSKRELIEGEDHVEINGVVFNKPFVEKPVSAEDHNIYIYYPTSAGGGSQRLFRKIGSRSSVYSPESRVRKTGSYIYEDFMPTDGTDVKVYTVGPDYAHAEARKSPALDGKVERDSEGKEVRYPIILSNTEKLIARKVCIAFKQTVCGFDLLRANGKSYVCDVNGFSFVKNSSKYYDDCARILGNMILRELAPAFHIPWAIPFQLDDPPIVPTTFGKMMELRCVVAVIRHGDRTPKQKMKMEVRHNKFFELFQKYDGYKDGHVKLKKPKQLQEVLDIARGLLVEIEQRRADPEIEEKKGKLEQLKTVLEMYGHFSGINRKVQLKYQPRGWKRHSSSEDGESPCEPSLVLILKWGGELTPAGRVQAEELGRIFRCMYPGGQERSDWIDESRPGCEYAGTQGLGLLRLHSTYRHDLKIYASDEGRVQMTAAAFAKGLLALEGELTPILMQMVKSANTNGLLDNDGDSYKHQSLVKTRLREMMQQDRDFTAEDMEALNPTHSRSIQIALQFIKNPYKMCEHIYILIQELNKLVEKKQEDYKNKELPLYNGETWELMQRRWAKLEKDFKSKNKFFDLSKIPDIYDCIKYDLQHNLHTLQFEGAEELYKCSKYLADVVIPQEYGISVQEKLAIGQGICTPLLKKIRSDLQRNIEADNEEGESINRLNPIYSRGVSSPGRHVRTRLYFTSESHIHSLLTVLRFGGLVDPAKDEQWKRAMDYVGAVSELNYLSQIVIMLYEDPTKDPSSESRFHVELHFSPGVNCCVHKNLPPGPGFRPKSRSEGIRGNPAIRKSHHVLVSPQSGGGEFQKLVTEEGSKSAEKETNKLSSNSDKDDEDYSLIRQDVLAKTFMRDRKNCVKSHTFRNKNGPTENVFNALSKPGMSGKTFQQILPNSLPSVQEQVEGNKGLALSEQVNSKLDDLHSGSANYSVANRECSVETSDGLPSYVTSGRSLSDGASVFRTPVVSEGKAPFVKSFEAESSQMSRKDDRESVRQHRHSIAGHMNPFLQYMSGLQLKGTSHHPSVPVFSTAVISGSTSAPDLRDNLTALPRMDVECLNDENGVLIQWDRNGDNTMPLISVEFAQVPSSVLDFDVVGGVPSIRPLETLHNALSLKQVDSFLSHMTRMVHRVTPLSSPAMGPSSPHHSQHSVPSSQLSSSLCSPSSNYEEMLKCDRRYRYY